MKNDRPIKGRYYIAGLISQGEHEHQDFKFAINDPLKIARSISAFANHGGGRLLIGVKDNGVVAGVRNDEDIYVVEQAASLYCRPSQSVEFTQFKAEGGAIVIRAEIPPSSERPVTCRDTDGSWRAYYRVADENIPASPLMIQAWRSRASGVIPRMGPVEQGVVALAANPAGLSPRQATIALKASLRSVKQAIVNLYCMGLVKFVRVSGEFRVVSVTDTVDATESADI